MGVIRQLPVRQETLALAAALNESSREDGTSAAAAAPAADADDAAATGGAVSGPAGTTDAASAASSANAASPMLALIRSKGFIWLSNSHPQMFYWALAGKHFELKQYASWWQCVPEEEWPQDAAELETVKKDFQGDYGDHRQELVFIGVRMDKAAIIKMLDVCLLTDSEMESYRRHWLG